MPTNIQANLILNDSQARQTISRLAKDVGSLNFAQPLGRISGDAKEFTKSLEAATARVTAFGLTAGALYKVSQAIREGAKATIEVDKQLVELNTYLGQSRKELEGFSQSLFKVAKNAAVPFEAASEAAKEFARQGLSANEILKRTESALTLARISGISYTQAVNGITTALNSFSKEALTAEEVTSKLIAVDTRFAVSSAQLNEALTRVGSSAEESGISIDKLIATVTAAQQITGRGGAVIGNALKTIFTRLQRPEVLSQLEQLGVAIKDQNGFLLDGISILKNYSDATKNLSQAEKARTAELVGGIYQINQVNALIKDLSSSNSIYANALKISSAATDEAKKKNEELNKSLSALLEQTKTSAQQAAAALGQSLLDPIVKLGSAASEALLKLVDPNSVGEEMGAAIAKGAASALGRGLVMGGGPLLAATGGLLAAKMFKYVSASAKELGSFSTNMFVSEKELQIQKRINDTLRQSPGIIADVRSGAMSLVDAEREVLRLIQEQNSSLLTQSRITGRVTSTVRTAQKASKKGFGRLFAEGYIPDTGIEEAAAKIEENTARRMGAVNPKAKVIQATIGGRTGSVIVNDKEKIIQNFAGTGETAIIPNYRNLSEIPRTAAAGYIPNFAKQRLGGGFFGEFFKLRGPLGRKDFFDPKSEITKSNVANEFVAGQELNQMIGAGALNPIFGSPAIYGSLSKSIKKSQIYKGIVSGRTGKDIAEGLDEYTGEKKGFEKILNLMLSRAQFQIDMGGRMKALDLVGKPENVILNEKTEGILSKISRRKYDKLLKSVDSKDFEQGEAQVDRIMSAIAKKGGQISILDPGIFELGPGLAKKRTKGLSDLGYRDKFSFSGGFIPNFAKIKDYPSDRQITARFKKGIEKGKYFADFYDRYEKANPLAGSDRELLNKIYASQSYGSDDSAVFDAATKIFKGVKSGETNFDSILKPLGLSKGRKVILNKILSGEELSTEKTGQYFKALSGDKNALAIDRNVINTALGRTTQKGESTSAEFRERLRKLIRKEAARSGMDPRAIQAALFAGRSPRQASFDAFDKGFSQFRSEGYIPNFAGLSNAISREKTMSGLPASQIMAHFDGKGNPVAVTNKRDEPRGLKDVPNFAVSKDLLKLFSKFKRGSLGNPISAGVELLQSGLITSIVDQLAEAEKISPEASAFTTGGVPAAYGLKNIGRGIFGKGSRLQKGFSIASGLGQLAYGGFIGSQAGDDIKKRINEKRYEEALDRSRKTYQDLTENTLELSNTLAKLDAAYRDPKADPKQITKLAKIREDLINKVSLKNPELVSKLASEQSIEGKINILEENTKESQRQQSIREQALKFSAKGPISGKEAPKEIGDFFASIINAGNENILKQDLSKATTANFGDVLKAGGLNVEELSNVFKTDDLKKAFIDALKVTQKLSELSARQERDITALSRPLAAQQQRVADAKEVRGEIRKALQEQLPELASFAGTFSKRAGISASSDATLAIKRTDAAVSFQNSLLAQLSDKEFAKGLPSEVESRLRNIDAPGKAAAKELETLKSLPGLSEKQIEGLDKLIGFNSQQARSVEKATIIANETKNIQLKFLALQEKLAFGGDIRTSINPQMRNEAMAAGIRGPLTYQLGGLLGSRRTQVGGAVDFLTDTIQKYPGLLQTKGGKEPMDIQAVKRELTGINAMDMQRDLLKRAGMAQMMGLGQTSGLLRSKAFDQGYLMESAGLKASALFGGPEVPEEIKNAMGEYERFNVQSARQSRAEDAALKTVEDFFVPLKQRITDQFTAEGNQLAKAFQDSLKTTFGDKGIIASLVNVTAEKFNLSSVGEAYKGMGGMMPTPAVKNFANPINDAVTREKMALAKRGIIGVPNFAMASINLERSPDLVTSSNPQGFGVTNSIDEKNGLRSLGMRSSGYVPNYALFGEKVASAGLTSAKAGNLFVYDHGADGFYKVTPSGRVGSQLFDKDSLPKGAKTISTQPYSAKTTSGQVRGSNILGIKDPRINKLDELKISTIPKSRRLDPILNKLSRAGKLTPENLLAEINKISGGNQTLVKTAFGSSFAQGQGVFGRGGGVGLGDTTEIIKRFQSGDARGFFTQAAVEGPHYGEMRVHVAVDSNGRVKLLKGGSILKIGGSAADITSKEGISALSKSGLGKEASKVAQEYKKAAQATAVRSIRELVAKKGLKNAFFGVDVGATTLESAQKAGVNTKEFYSGGRGRVGTVVFELNPSESLGSSGYIRGSTTQKLVDQVLGRQVGVMPPGFAPKGTGSAKNMADAYTASIAQQSSSASKYRPTVNSRLEDLYGKNYGPSAARMRNNYKTLSPEQVNKILSGNKSASSGSVSSVAMPSGGTGKAALKFLGKYGGKALGALGGATSIYGYYEGFQEAKKDKYAGAAKMLESTGGLALAGAGLAGAGLATTLALPLAVGALGYGAIKGVEATGLLDAMYGAGYGTVGLGVIGSKSIRGMTSRTAFNDDMIVARKQELLKEINRYNSVAGNPLVSTEFQLSRSAAAQNKKDEQDLATLMGNLDRESEATRAAIAARAAGAGAAETARLNKQSASEEDARSSALRRSFLESFDKNAESAGYLTTQDKVNFLLGQEGKNGLGSFKPTDFADPEFARSFNTYREARDRFAATEAPTTLEFKSMQSQARTGFSDDVLREAVARGVSAETIEEERARKQAAAQGAIPNFAAMSNSMMSSGDVYSRMRATSARSSMGSYSGGYIPNFAAGDFTNAITEALRNGITSAFPDGPSSSSVSNSNVINIDGRTSIQNAPDEAMQGIISILFDKIPELKKLGPAALNFKR